ncbi:36083_t:CDS:2, partial [Racocetra persica]
GAGVFKKLQPKTHVMTHVMTCNNTYRIIVTRAKQYPLDALCLHAQYESPVSLESIDGADPSDPRNKGKNIAVDGADPSDPRNRKGKHISVDGADPSDPRNKGTYSTES